jgi:hypothetical protein
MGHFDNLPIFVQVKLCSEEKFLCTALVGSDS